MDGHARIYYVNGRRDAAGRLRDELAQHHGQDRRTEQGRLIEGLERAVALIDPTPVLPDGPWEEFVGVTASVCDVAEVGLYLGEVADYPPDEKADPYPDPLPVRLRLTDGGDSTSSTAYLTPDEAEHLAGNLLAAAERARDAADLHALAMEGRTP